MGQAEARPSPIHRSLRSGPTALGRDDKVGVVRPSVGMTKGAISRSVGMTEG